MERRIKLSTLNSHITCGICEGYFIDATTVTECLHTCKYCVPCSQLKSRRTATPIRWKLVRNFRPSNLFDTHFVHNSVCKSCLVKHLEENNTCPACDMVIHQSHPLQYISFDRTMQDIVYKLVPNLQEGNSTRSVTKPTIYY